MDKQSQDHKASDLRRLAEEVVSNKKSRDSLSGTELHRYIHELEVHQIELEIQNDEILRAKTELESLLAKYTDLYDFSPVGYLTVDQNGIILDANLTSTRFLEIERSRLPGQSFFNYMSASDRHDFDIFLTTVFSSENKNACEIMLPRKDSSPLYLQVEALKAKEENECRLALVDINDRKKAEEFLLRNEKLESLGKLAGGIAHDFNNILTVVLGNVAMARAQKNGPGRLAVRLKNIEKASEKAKNLTMQLATFASGGTLEKKEIQIEDVLRSAVKKARTGYTNKCLFNISRNLLHVDADARQLSHVFHNLALNAFHAMPDNGQVEITAENMERVPGERDKVKISFHDTGPIITRDQRLKIFDPFYAMSINGSGLGLAVCNSIVKKHNGDIQVTSDRQRTTFTVVLPAAEHQSTQSFKTHSDILHGSGRILVMDDESGIRDILKSLLKSLGYQVESTGNGSDAVKLYLKRKAEGKPFNAVIFDLIVPGDMGGREAVLELNKLEPGIKAIVSSGNTIDPVMSDFQEYGFSAVLKKPYQIEELSHVLAEVMES